MSFGLINYYSPWKDSQTDIAVLCEPLTALSQTFRLIEEGVKAPLHGSEVVERVTEGLVACAAGIQRLQDELDKAKSSGPGHLASLRSKAQYPFRERTIAKLQGTVSSLRDKLSLAVDALQIETASNSLEKLRAIDGKMDSIIAHSLETEDIVTISWLSTLDSKAKQILVLRRRHEGTRHWLLNSSEFYNWVAGRQISTLYCRGLSSATRKI